MASTGHLRSIGAARTAAAVAALALGALAGCGAASAPQRQAAPGPRNADATGPVLHGHPQVVEPTAGAAAAPSAGGAPSSVSVGSAAPSGALAQPVSLGQVRQELQASGLTASNARATLAPDGLAIAPVNAPAQVQEVIDAGNEIAHLPYRFGGGHGTFVDTAYDCSGSLSFVFAAAGLLNTTMTSGSLENWGRPGAGRWITVFANAGHTFMYVAGLRFDTVALAETGSRWSNRSADEPDLRTFTVRHPPGL